MRVGMICTGAISQKYALALQNICYRVISEYSILLKPLTKGSCKWMFDSVGTNAEGDRSQVFSRR